MDWSIETFWKITSYILATEHFFTLYGLGEVLQKMAWEKILLSNFGLLAFQPSSNANKFIGFHDPTPHVHELMYVDRFCRIVLPIFDTFDILHFVAKIKAK